MLPNVMPQARIWVYDYNSNYSNNAQHIDILGLGTTFLEILLGAQDRDVGKRPLIFIGSCFGGIVIAQVRRGIYRSKVLAGCFLLTIAMQALERASRDETKYAYLLKSTIGVIFLGTPLRGTPTASVAQWVALIRGFMGKETSDILLQSLKNESGNLDTLVHDFSKLAIKLGKEHAFQLRCFYETRASQIANAISRNISRVFPIPEVKV